MRSSSPMGTCLSRQGHKYLLCNVHIEVSTNYLVRFFNVVLLFSIQGYQSLFSHVLRSQPHRFVGIERASERTNEERSLYFVLRRLLFPLPFSSESSRWMLLTTASTRRRERTRENVINETPVNSFFFFFCHFQMSTSNLISASLEKKTNRR